MEGNSYWNPNEQSIVNNVNDWRSYHEPDLRYNVVSEIVQRSKRYFPNLSINQIEDFALKFEENIYGLASDKDDYTQTISREMLMMERKYLNIHSVSSVNETNNTLDPAAAAQVLNQGRQQLLPQQQQPQQPHNTTYIRMSERVHASFLPDSQVQMQGRQALLPQLQQTQQQPQFTHCMCQYHRNLRHSHMQQQAQLPQQYGLLKQPIQQQQFPHPTSFPSIQHPFARFSAASSSSTSGQQNSPFLLRSQLSPLRVYASSQQKMAALSQEPELDEVEKFMNGLSTRHNHLTTWPNNGEHQGAFRESSSQQSNPASFRGMAQQNMHQQRLSFHSDNASAFPSKQQQNIPCGESGYFNVYGSSFLGTQGQEPGQSQPMMHQSQHLEQLPPENRSFQQYLDESQRFQATDSLRHTQNRVDQQNQSYPLQRVTPANPSTSQDSAGETVNASGGDWKEETYQKIKASKEKSLPFLSALLQNIVEKLQEVDSLPRQEGENLRMGKWAVEQAIQLLNVHRSRVSEEIRDKFATIEEQLESWTRKKTEPPIQQQQGQSPPSQIHQNTSQSQIPQVNVTQSFENDQMNSQNPKFVPSDISLVQSAMLQQKQFHHWLTQQQINSLLQIPEENQQLQMPTSHQTNVMNDVRMRQGNNIEAGLLQQHLSSSHHQLPTPLASPAQLVDQEILPALVNQTGTPTQSADSPLTPFALSFGVAVESTQEQPVFTRSHVPIAEDSFDRMIREVLSWPQEFWEDSVNETSSVIRLHERISERSLTANEEPNQFKRRKRSITSQN